MSKLKKNNIAFSYNTIDYWYDIDKIYKHGRNKEDIIKNYRNYQIPCVSLMISEDLENKQLASKGAIFICPILKILITFKRT